MDLPETPSVTPRDGSVLDRARPVQPKNQLRLSNRSHQVSLMHPARFVVYIQQPPPIITDTNIASVIDPGSRYFMYSIYGYSSTTSRAV